MKGTLTILFAASFFALHSQQVDLVRLAYDEAALSSHQTGMAASGDGKYIAFAYEDKTIKVFDVYAGKFVQRFTSPYVTLVDMHVISNATIALIGSREVQILDWRTAKSLAKFPMQQEVSKTAYSEKNNLLAVGQFEGFVSLIDVKKFTILKTLQYSKHHVSALAINPNGKTLVIGAQGAGMFPNALKLFNIASGEEIAHSKKGVFTMVEFSRNGDRLIAGGKMGDVGYRVVTAILDAKHMSVVREVSSRPMRGSILNVPFGAFINDNKVMVLSDTRSFDVLDLVSGEELFTTMREKGSITKTSKLGVGSFNVFPLDRSGSIVIVNTTKNNINQIYDANANAMVGYFYSDSNDDFAVVSRDGRVEGTQGALSKLYWTSRKSTKRTSLESTFEKGFTPRLLSQILGGAKAPEVAFEVDDVVDKIPVLSLRTVNGKSGVDPANFETTQKNIKLEIEVKHGAGEVTDVKLFQNSKLVKAITNQGKSTYTFDVSLTNSMGAENFFFASAGSKSGIESEKIKFTVLYKGATEGKPRLFLVTIGINNYKNPKYDLNYAKADADGVADMITEKSNSLFTTIVPFSIRNDNAIKANIFSALEEIREKSLEQDMLLVYYAGHGVMSEGVDRDKDFFIIPHDVTQLYGKDELLYEKAISATELKAFTQQINAQKQIFILDACQSSGALEALESTYRGAAEEKAIAQLARSTGTFWITSTGADQFASEFEKLGHGAFTYVLLEGIQGAGDTNADRKLTIRELSAYIENKVPELSEQLKGTAQFPSAYSYGNDFPLAVYEY